MQKPSAKIQTLHSISGHNITVDILRTDLLHPVVSGNKLFKLSPYLEDAQQQGATTIASFGGAFSNHIVATAYAAREHGLRSVGIIRGEASPRQPSLDEAASYGMALQFVSREAYRNKAALVTRMSAPGYYWIPEGGYGGLGAQGAAGMLQAADTSSYTHILCATGTGTMLAGLVQAARPGQSVTGISVLKNHLGLEDDVKALLEDEDRNKPFSIRHNYHFGGYARHPYALIKFMVQLWEEEGLPTDIVYTAKLLFAAQDLVKQQQFPAGSRLLLIHSGGLQGNRSLPPDTLPF